jgi:hypothetical protein
MKAIDSRVLDVVYSQSDLFHLNYHMTSTRGDRNLSWSITNHAQKRISQRAKNYDCILIALEYGECIFKQNLCFYVATNKSLPKQIDSKLRDAALNTVVVVSNDGSIITCYKSAKGIKTLKKKSKRLYKFSA